MQFDLLISGQSKTVLDRQKSILDQEIETLLQQTNKIRFSSSVYMVNGLVFSQAVGNTCNNFMFVLCITSPFKTPGLSNSAALNFFYIFFVNFGAKCCLQAILSGPPKSFFELLVEIPYK